MTHQEIVDALGTVYARATEAVKAEREWILGEKARLVAECAAAGHVWGRSKAFTPITQRCCQICDTWEPE